MTLKLIFTAPKGLNADGMYGAGFQILRSDDDLKNAENIEVND